MKRPPNSNANVSEVNHGKGKANGKGGSHEKTEEEDMQVQKGDNTKKNHAHEKKDTKDGHKKGGKDDNDKKTKGKRDKNENHPNESNQDKFDPASQVARVAKALEKTLG